MGARGRNRRTEAAAAGEVTRNRSVPSWTHRRCTATSGQYTTARGTGGAAARAERRPTRAASFSPAAAPAPVANTLMITSAGSRSSSARSIAAVRAVAAESILTDSALPVRRCAKCRPSYRPGTAIRVSKTRCPARAAALPSRAMLSRVRTLHPASCSRVRRLCTGISWPSPRGPDSRSARHITIIPHTGHPLGGTLRLSEIMGYEGDINGIEVLTRTVSRATGRATGSSFSAGPAMRASRAG